MDNIYYVEISGNKVKSYINLNPKDIAVKPKEEKQITGMLFSEIINSIFEVKRKSEITFIEGDEDLILTHYLLGDEDDDIDIEDDIDIDDLFI